MHPDSKKPFLPRHVYQKWKSHERFGGKMMQRMDALVEEFGEAILAEELASSASGATPNKRPGAELGGSPAKKPNLTCQELKDWDGEELVKIPLLNVKSDKALLDIRAGGKVGLVNKDDKRDLMCPQGFILAGFGKGKFNLAEQLQPKGEEGAAEPIPYSLGGQDSLVHFNNKLVTLREVYDEKSRSQHNPVINYYKIEAAPTEEDPGFFTLAKEHGIAFVPIGITDAMLQQTSAASKIPADQWDPAVCGVVWACKWQPNGLMPIRPVVVALQAISIPPGCVLPLTKVMG